LAADDPLAEIRTVTRWHGGYIGRGDPAAQDGSKPASGDPAVHTRLWTSTDGRTWEPLGADVFSASAIVVGMAPTTEGIVALTVLPGPTIRDDETEDLSWSVAGPVQAWTSSDGSTWTAHPGPDLELPSATSLTVHDTDWLQVSTAPLVFVARGSRPPFVSTDGIEWRRQTTSGLPTSFRLPSIIGVGSGFVAVGDDAIASSPDGRTWTTKAWPETCSANQGIVVGRDGMIVTGISDGGGHSAPWTWCSSLGGRTWRNLSGLPPLGVMHEADAQDCLASCPDGTLIGDGLRMVAYRGWGDDQTGWTSFDGRTWQPLDFDGRPQVPPVSTFDRCTLSVVLMPTGLRCTDEGGTIWFGEGRS
jgi:hypothetical protein